MGSPSMTPRQRVCLVRSMHVGLQGSDRAKHGRTIRTLDRQRATTTTTTGHNTHRARQRIS
eukprot:2560099-Alexandrium_andersonii.AAC.2